MVILVVRSNSRLYDAAFDVSLPVWSCICVTAAYQSAPGVSEVPDHQTAATATSNFAIFFTFSVASAVLYIAFT
jgi:hypothetical protein